MGLYTNHSQIYFREKIKSYIWERRKTSKIRKKTRYHWIFERGKL